MKPVVPGRRPLGLSQPGLLVTDVDSTVIEQEVIELLAAYAGSQDEVARVTESAMRGELDFAQSLHARVATLAGLPVEVLDRVTAEVRLSPGAETLFATVSQHGWPTGLVSGGFAEIVQPIADRLGVRHVRANRLEVSDGKLTGRVLGEVVDAAEKERMLRGWASADGIPLERTVAVGDGANDLLMLGAAGLAVAWRAKPVVRAQVRHNIEASLAEVLTLLGVPRKDWAEASLESGHAQG
ncbi:phosphoserine phosphatase SerB [Calidifontibacter sp. DB0510]|uniref:phosphoserine phosphatase n=1 Tax=Metallococcus carri TaxID=1656884 RepID=A0A967EDM4_9MICO|nr:phosphoserine phosphatase SerB [Metallococcus carri]NHN54871.1 phosphoserine phosphatase SerB [Metallococcus carri]NOP37216.1 phosphoserine phosphatase SerB [Calidifontibacter sp. DB2511S]